MAKMRNKHFKVKVGKLYVTGVERLYDYYAFEFTPDEDKAKKHIHPVAKATAEILGGEIISPFDNMEKRKPLKEDYEFEDGEAYDMLHDLINSADPHYRKGLKKAFEEICREAGNMDEIVNIYDTAIDMKKRGSHRLSDTRDYKNFFIDHATRLIENHKSGYHISRYEKPSDGNESEDNPLRGAFDL